MYFFDPDFWPSAFTSYINNFLLLRFGLCFSFDIVALLLDFFVIGLGLDARFYGVFFFLLGLIYGRSAIMLI